MNAGQTLDALSEAAGERVPFPDVTEARVCSPAAPTVFIGVPIMFQVDPHFFQCCMHLPFALQQLGVHGEFKPNVGDSAVGRSRNSLTRKFLESKCSHFLMIDSDLVFSAQHVHRILSHEQDIVAGLYFKKSEGEPQAVINALPGEQEARPDGLLEVRYAGTGFICVARRVFERMIEQLGDEIGYLSDHDHVQEYDFWRMGVCKFPDSHPRWLSEDWYFCEMARRLGFKVYVDRGIVLRHSGNALYPLSYQQPKIFGPLPQGTSDTLKV